VDLEVVAETLALSYWQLQVRKLYDPIDADTEIAKMEEKIRRVLSRGPISERELRQKTNADRTGLWVFSNALKNLQNSKEISLSINNRKWMRRTDDA
jgi:hypothetical protein